MKRKRVLKSWCMMTDALTNVFVGVRDFIVENGVLKEPRFWTATSGIFARYVQMAFLLRYTAWSCMPLESCM